MFNTCPSYGQSMCCNTTCNSEHLPLFWLFELEEKIVYSFLSSKSHSILGRELVFSNFMDNTQCTVQRTVHSTPHHAQYTAPCTVRYTVHHILHRMLNSALISALCTQSRMIQLTNSACLWFVCFSLI